MQATFRGATKIEATHEVANFNPLDYQNTNHGWRSNDVAGKIKYKFAMIHFQIRKLRCNLNIRNIVIRKGGEQFRLLVRSSTNYLSNVQQNVRHLNRTPQRSLAVWPRSRFTWPSWERVQVPGPGSCASASDEHPRMLPCPTALQPPQAGPDEGRRPERKTNPGRIRNGISVCTSRCGEQRRIQDYTKPLRNSCCIDKNTW